MTAQNRGAWALYAVVVFAAGTVTVLSCRGAFDESRAGSQATSVDHVAGAEQMNCPHDFHVTAPNSTRDITVVPLAGSITNVVGYHDCQRLIVDSGRSYGPLVAVYASSRLASIEGDLKAAGTSLAVAAAEIYSYDGAYAPLGIELGFNCLYLWQAAGWQAEMVPVGYDEKACLQPIPAGDPRGKRLQVRADRYIGLVQSDYPPVARWDWDAVHLNQYVAVACGAAWCEIGAAGFEPSSPVELAGLGSSRVAEVKGWFDEQALAVTGPDGILRPGTVRGAVFPSPDLSSEQDTSAYDGRWVRAATVVLDGQSSVYKEKFNFDQGANTLYLCRGARADCIPPSVPQPSCTAGSWWAKTVSAAGDVSYRCVTYNDHAGLPVPGTARWHWVAKDESVWMRCDAGCCTPY